MFWKSEQFLYQLQILFYKVLYFLAGPMLRSLIYLTVTVAHYFFIMLFREHLKHSPASNTAHWARVKPCFMQSPWHLLHLWQHKWAPICISRADEWRAIHTQPFPCYSWCLAEPPVFSAGALTLLTLPSGAHCHGLLLLAPVTPPLAAPLSSFQGGMIWRYLSFGLTAIICGSQSENTNWSENNQCSLLSSRPVTVTFSWLYST